MTNEEAKVFLDNLKICINEHPVVADWLVEIADRKTEPQIKQSEEFKQFIGHDCSKCRWSKCGEACAIPCCDFEPKDEPQTEDTCKGCVNETDCPWK